MIKSAVSVLICIVIVFSLCACTAEKEFILGEFCRNVSFTMDEVSVKGELNFKNKDNITFTIIEPENLKDITFTESQINKDDVTISYSKLKDNSPVYILLSVVKSLSENGIYLPMKDEFTFTGETDSAEYKVIFDCEKEEIKRIETEKFIYNFE